MKEQNQLQSKVLQLLEKFTVPDRIKVPPITDKPVSVVIVGTELFGRSNFIHDIAKRVVSFDRCYIGFDYGNKPDYSVKVEIQRG